VRAASIDELLGEARERGYLGPGPIDEHIRHAAALAALAAPVESPWLDLGSGGGIPGLAWLAAPGLGAGVLVDANARRCDFLTDAVGRLGVAERGSVVCGRAEVLARDPALRDRFPLVVARAFGAPATTAECAVAFLRVGGRLVVSEPPPADAPESAAEDPPRWSSEGLARLGFGPATVVRGDGVSAAVITRVDADGGDRWPRRDGVPSKRPLW
jgi:16S rRNA (guanine527-N7)-methyltransferase